MIVLRRYRQLAKYLALLSVGLSLAFGTNVNGPSQLRPEHGELAFSGGAQNAIFILLGTALVIAAVGLGIALLMRTKPAAITSKDDLVRRALENLRGRAEDDALVVEVSRIVRGYVIYAFGLPPGELTSAEIARALGSLTPPRQELFGTITNFLQQCDEKKFAPASPPQPAVVSRALDLVEKISGHRPAAPDINSNPASAGTVSSAAT
jgi:hypothetical protein